MELPDGDREGIWNGNNCSVNAISSLARGWAQLPRVLTGGRVSNKQDPQRVFRKPTLFCAYPSLPLNFFYECALSCCLGMN